jgi:putative DNA methylase
MTMRYPKRLIEVDLPIARISAHSRREKSIRHGHISTLHIWWARRPLAACRAVTCAALWPDPGDELCPQAFRVAAVEQIKAFARRVFPEKITEEGRLLSSDKHLSFESRGRWEAIAAGTLTLDAEEPVDMPMLRMCLLDFIADFANWDNSTVPAYLETSRALTQAAHEALGGVPGTRPLVVDPFAGGGSIPLEALRVGADAFASDLNPVAVLLNKVVLEYIPKYGQRLADEVRKWGEWVKEQAEQELAEFYPNDPDGATPIAYLWARTILSEAPGEGEAVEVPVFRSMWLSKGRIKKALRWRRDKNNHVETQTATVAYADGTTRQVRRPVLEIFEPSKESDVCDGTVARGAVTCPVTGYTTPVANIRVQLKSRKGGTRDARLLAVVLANRGDGKSYRLANDLDFETAHKCEKHLQQREQENKRGLSVVPNETISLNEIRRISLPIYGMTEWGHAFSARQSLVLSTLGRCVRLSPIEGDSDEIKAIRSVLALAVDRQADFQSSLVTWTAGGEFLGHTFTRQALGMVWDFAEGNPWADTSGNWDGAIGWICRVLEHCAAASTPSGTIQQASATDHPLPDDAAAAIITDPPYYDAVPYSHLSDYFYVWLRRTLQDDEVGLAEVEAVPKAEEIVVDRPHSLSTSNKGIEFYEANLQLAFADARRVVQPSGVGTIVFASKSTASWEAILQAVVEAGWTITASWPIDTEREARIAAQGQARLGSSVHLVCRPRENESGELREEVGEWRDVLSELPQRIHEWMPRLAAEGVVGADAIFACLGPALEIFSRYSRVEKASGEAVPLREYLEQVWAAVSTEALSMIFKDADAAGLEPDARLTAMWLWTLGANTGDSNGKGKSSDDKVTASTGYTLEYDAARKIAQGLGIHLEQSESIVEVKGDKARMLPVSERTRYLFGKDEADARTARGRKKKKTEQQRSLFEELDALESEPDVETVAGELKPQAGETVLDRVHQSMILFASGRGEALRRFLVEDGAGNDARFWKLAQSLSALYPKDTDEKRWVDGVLARKKGLGL